MSKPVCLIWCNHCKQPFRSPIQDAEPTAFFTWELAGNEIQYRESGKMTSGNRENICFDACDGTVFHGPEPIPE